MLAKQIERIEHKVFGRGNDDLSVYSAKHFQSSAGRGLRFHVYTPWPLFDAHPVMPDYLYVFIDEAGDLNFSRTGTKYFTITAATRARPFVWENSIASLKYDLIEFGLDIEYFHAAEDRQAVRDRFFSIVCDHSTELRLDTIIIEKSKTGPALREVEAFYPRMVGYLLRYILEHRNINNCAGVVIITDSIPIKKKRKSIEKAIKMTVSGILPSDMKYSVLHHASKSCTGLQIVDYCNWAIFRKWERSDTRSYEFIQPCIRSEFEIFRAGSRHYY